ncbi:MAG: tRNA (adenosine(37)-N6)-dimethylallyltransferase MiaA [Clostridiales bacterium]|nr:tRNA (adenosine(37)-N6)-dimethylallyltransferase MiaA [Clostridiales bacterium]
MKPRIIAITGCTASGKSSLAMELAGKHGCEIVCMDSMQVYTGMDIGTAKPSKADRQRIPHHMLDVVSPVEPYAVADYVKGAEAVFEQIWQRGKTPMLVGGTGLYLKSLLHGMTLGVEKSDPEIRSRYESIAARPDGREQLHAMLEQVDPSSAAKLHPNDLRRVIRALEVYELTGTPLSQQKREEPERPYDIFPLVLMMPREKLQKRIALRVDEMFQAGLVEEVRTLLASGVPADAQSMQAIGYKELIPVVRDGLAQSVAKEQIVLGTRHYAKRQETWFKGEKLLVPLDAENAPLATADAQIHAFLNT